jgi:hypothetical protein
MLLKMQHQSQPYQHWALIFIFEEQIIIIIIVNIIIIDPQQRQRISLPSASRPALGPTQPPVQGVPGALCPGIKSGRGVMLTTHPLLVPRLRKSRSYTSCHPNAPLWSVTGPLFLYYYHRLSLVAWCSVRHQRLLYFSSRSIMAVVVAPLL